MNRENDGADNRERERAEFREMHQMTMRALATLQASVDCVSQNINNRSLKLPIRTEEELEEVEERLQNPREHQIISNQLQNVVRQDVKWLEKVLDQHLLLKFNINRTEGTNCIMDLEIIAICREHAIRKEKGDVVKQLRNIKDRVKKSLKPREKRNKNTSPPEQSTSGSGGSDSSCMMPQATTSSVHESTHQQQWGIDK
ncbi:hypothetical protein DMENIID0001_009470 [Sergentomyia squamirostris]